jgi:3-mercaptopyruvate sulfurtransferase SseA
MEAEVETSLTAVASATAVAVPTTPKPTATFVPLITPSPTPTGDQPGRASVRRIGIAEARALAEAGSAVLVDVRTRGTYERAHIAGALSLPLDEVTERAHELADETLIIFYCA